MLYQDDPWDWADLRHNGRSAPEQVLQRQGHKGQDIFQGVKGAINILLPVVSSLTQAKLRTRKWTQIRRRSWQLNLIQAKQN